MIEPKIKIDEFARSSRGWYKTAHDLWNVYCPFDESGAHSLIVKDRAGYVESIECCRGHDPAEIIRELGFGTEVDVFTRFRFESAIVQSAIDKLAYAKTLSREDVSRLKTACSRLNNMVGRLTHRG